MWQIEGQPTQPREADPKAGTPTGTPTATRLAAGRVLALDFPASTPVCVRPEVCTVLLYSSYAWYLLLYWTSKSHVPQRVKSSKPETNMIGVARISHERVDDHVCLPDSVEQKDLFHGFHCP